MLTEHDKFVEQVAASYAHEIKNPIAIIKAHLQLLELDDKDKAHQNSFRVAHKELDRINRLVYDLMNTFKPQCINFSSISIEEPLREIVEAYEPIFATENISISISISSKSVILADRHKLMQVLINILNNAVEALRCKDGDKNISLSCYDINNYVVIEIKDNGNGIAGEHLNKIGEAFFSTKTEGNGLGLFLSRKIVDEHKGSMTLSNNPDDGCFVSIQLPTTV